MAATLTEVIGDVDSHGQPISLRAVLPLVDMAAGRCAFMRAAGPVVTASLDDVELLCTLFHGDLISAEAEVVAVGRSSMLLRILVSRDRFCDGERHLSLVARCYATFVAVDSDTGRSRPVPPSSESLSSFSQPSQVNSHQSAQFDESITALQAKYKKDRGIFSTDDVSTLHALAESRCSFSNLSKYSADFDLYDIPSTLIRIRKQYLPRHQNFSGKIFGGDILETLENAAVACANRIQGGKMQLMTVGIRSLAFLQPVSVLDVLEVEAKVIATSQRVVCVILRSYLDENTRMIPCHHGIFHLIPTDRSTCNRTLSAGVRTIWKRDDDQIKEFYRAMALPLTSGVCDAWKLANDAFPTEWEASFQEAVKSSDMSAVGSK